MSYETDRAWSDKFLPEIKRIVGPYLLVPSSFEEDTKQAADLVVLRARDLTIACRVRRHGYAEKYGNQFTIRSKRDNGAETEMHKIVNGWGDWMFYAHSNATETAFDIWWIINLAHWRAHLVRNQKRIKWDKQPNGDGTHFTWFDITTFPPDPPIVVGCSRMEEIAKNQYAQST